MENLLLQSKKVSQEGQYYSNLSPQKSIKTSNEQLTFTPSNIAQFHMTKEFSNQKRMQENMSKLRQTQAFNDIFKQRLDSLKQEKQGIQRTLYEQIGMYKKMIAEKQLKNQVRVKDLQQKFNSQMNRIIDQRQQQGRNAQKEKKAMEKRISELQQHLEDIYSQLQDKGKDHDSLRYQNDQLAKAQDSLGKRLQEAQNSFREQQQGWKAQHEDLKRHFAQKESQWKQELKTQVQSKVRELQNMQNQHRDELQRLQDIGVQKHTLKSQELRNLTGTFQRESARLNDIIFKKEQQAQALSKILESEREKVHLQSKGYQNEIYSLSHEKSRLEEQLIKAGLKVGEMAFQNQELQQSLNSMKSELQGQNVQLKKDLQLVQINLMREVDKNAYALDGLSDQIARLQVENQQAIFFREQNTHLLRQIGNLKELLIESSVQMEKCKQQFLRIGRQKDMLITRLKQYGVQNETLYRIKNQRQQEARGWKESYLIQRSQY